MPARAACQDAETKRFGVAVGLASYQLKDRVLNDLRHDGLFVSAGVFYERCATSSIGRFNVDLTFSPLGSRYEPDGGSFLSGLRLAYHHLRAVTAAGPTTIALGAFVAGGSDLAYFENWDDSHVYWLTAYTLGLDARIDLYGSRDRELSLELSVPLVGLVSRPDWPVLYKVVNADFGWMVDRLHEGLRLTSIHEHRALDATVRYSGATDSFGPSLFWQVRYTHNDVPGSRSFDLLRHSVGVSVRP